MLTGLRRCCKTAQKPGRCKQGITARQLRSEGKGSIPTFVVFFLFLFLLRNQKSWAFRKKGRGKIVKCLQIYCFSEPLSKPRTGHHVARWMMSAQGNKNKAKISSPGPERPYKGIQRWLQMNRVFVVLASHTRLLTSTNSQFLGKQFSKSCRLFLSLLCLGCVEATALSPGYLGSVLTFPL